MIMNKRNFLGLCLASIFMPNYFGEKETKKIILYGYNWQFNSYINEIGKYECKYYPNKTNRREYVYFPPNPITVEQDKYHGIKYIHGPGRKIETVNPYLNGAYYYNNGAKNIITSQIRDTVGLYDIACKIMEFEVLV